MDMSSLLMDNAVMGRDECDFHAELIYLLYSSLFHRFIVILHVIPPFDGSHRRPPNHQIRQHLFYFGR